MSFGKRQFLLATTVLLAASDLTAGGFQSTGDLNIPRRNHTATLLRSGAILVTGGESLNVGAQGSARFTAELYDPTAGTWRFARQSMIFGHDLHTATLMADGRVLVSSGYDGLTGAYSGVEIFDPADESFHAVRTLSVPRARHFAVLLGDGRVMIAGGSTASPVEIYNPGNDSWVTAAAYPASVTVPNFLSLPDGTVLGSGGLDLATGQSTRAIFRYFPAQDHWQSMIPMSVGRRDHSAVVLPGGRVLFISAGTSEVYDPAPAAGGTGSVVWTGTAYDPSVLSPTAVSLGNGKVLLTGGVLVYDGPSPPSPCICIMGSNSAFVFDAASLQWTPQAPMNVPRGAHTLTLMRSGAVLVAGGYSYESPAPFHQLTFSQPQETWKADGKPLPSLSASPLGLSFSSVGTRAIDSKSLTVSSSGSPIDFTVAVSTTSGASWLSVARTTGTTPATISVSIAPGLAPGLYVGKLTITAASSAQGSIAVPVSVTVINGPTGSLLVNSNFPRASYSISPAVPLATGSGPFPVRLDNVPAGKYTVTFGAFAGYYAPDPLTVDVAADKLNYVAAKYRRVLVVLFTGFGSTPDDGGDVYPLFWQEPGLGMSTLANSILADSSLQRAARVGLYTFYSSGNGGETCYFGRGDAIVGCTPPPNNADDPAPQAWIQSFNPGEEDRIVVMGHSYGGNRARLFAQQLTSRSYTVDDLSVVDPIDWDRCSIQTLALGCKQHDFTHATPDNVSQVYAFIQNDSAALNGYHLTELPGTISLRAFPACYFDLFCSHGAIDDDPEVQKALLAIVEQTLRSPRKALSSISVSQLQSTSADVAWKTLSITAGDLQLATDSTLSAWYHAGHDAGTTHSVHLAGLSPHTTYFYRIASTMTLANSPVYSDIYSFSTP